MIHIAILFIQKIIDWLLTVLRYVFTFEWAKQNKTHTNKKTSLYSQITTVNNTLCGERQTKRMKKRSR